MSKSVYIVGARRTPIGSFLGSLSDVKATELGSIAVKGALEDAGISPENIDEIYFGNVISAALGQAPATQVMLGAGIPSSVPATTVNKVCASGLKSVMIGATSIRVGDSEVIVAGGMESMSQAPFYVTHHRKGFKFGNQELLDSLVKDGLQDVYKKYMMGDAAEVCAAEYNITREEQDEYAILSYKRALDAQEKGYFKNEIVPVTIKTRKGEIVVSEDEEPKRVRFDKIPNLRPAFKKDGGTITAANASKINDGAASVIIASEDAVKKYNLKPLARIVSYADAAKDPEWFTIAPTDAIKFALNKAGMNLEQIDFFEINEAFAVVSLVNEKLLGIPREKVNVLGGAVALGHPLGASGARILITLINALKIHNKKYGAIGICNGGGGASAMIIENL